MTETPKAPRKRAAKKPLAELRAEDEQGRRDLAALRKPKPGAIHADARVITADGKRRRLTALDKARLIVTRAQAPRYAVRGSFAGWMLSTVSPNALATATARVTHGVDNPQLIAYCDRAGRGLTVRPRAYFLFHRSKRPVRFA